MEDFERSLESRSDRETGLRARKKNAKGKEKATEGNAVEPTDEYKARWLLVSNRYGCTKGTKSKRKNWDQYSRCPRSPKVNLPPFMSVRYIVHLPTLVPRHLR